MFCVATAFLVLVSVWSLLLTAELAASALDSAWVTPLAMLGSATLVWSSAGGFREARGSTPQATLVVGLVAGLVAWRGVAVLIYGAGLGLGFPPPELEGSPLGFVEILVALVLAPALEERLYRDLLLAPLRRRFGGGAAVVLTSVLFALPHRELWPVFGTFFVGLGLGALRVRSRSTLLCIGVHSGLNLAALLEWIRIGA